MFAQTTRSLPSAWAPGTSTPRAPNAGGQAFLAMPFDAMRFHYASVVTTGLAQRSLLASGQFERALDTLEKLILGPLARQG